MHAGVVEIPAKAGSGDAEAFRERDEADEVALLTRQGNGALRGDAVNFLLVVEESELALGRECIGDEEVIEEVIDASSGAAEDEEPGGGGRDMAEGFFEVGGGLFGSLHALAANGPGRGRDGIKIADEQIRLAVDGVEGIKAAIGGDDGIIRLQCPAEESLGGRFAAEDENGGAHGGGRER